MLFALICASCAHPPLSVLHPASDPWYFPSWILSLWNLSPPFFITGSKKIYQFHFLIISHPTCIIRKMWLCGFGLRQLIGFFHVILFRPIELKRSNWSDSCRTNWLMLTFKLPDYVFRDNHRLYCSKHWKSEDIQYGHLSMTELSRLSKCHNIISDLFIGPIFKLVQWRI